MVYHAFSVVGSACTLGCCLHQQTKLPTVYVTVHENATAFLKAVGPWLHADEVAANTIFPYSEALSLIERKAPHATSLQSWSNNLTIWVSCWSLSPPQPTTQDVSPEMGADETRDSTRLDPQLEFVAMSGTNHLGPMPVFLFSPSACDNATSNFNSTVLAVGMRNTVAKIAEFVPPERVCSTFGRASLAGAFAAAWEAHTGYSRIPGPLKRTRMLFCPSRTCAVKEDEPAEVLAATQVRRVEEADVSTASDIWHLFSLVNSPFPLALEESNSHACHLATAQQAWVCIINEARTLPRSGDTTRVVSFCEVSRRSKNVAVITKIFTLPEHRRHGYATLLLQGVMRSLASAGITTVITYATSGESFEHCIWTRMGFSGYDSNEWVEWGFEGSASFW